jgi:hypothetical protein
MKQTRTIVLALGGFCLVCGIVWLEFRTSRRTLPTYNGKTVEEWFYGPDHHCGKNIESAQLAFARMGTNCVPFLLQNLRQRESKFGKLYIKVFPVLPGFVRSKLRQPLEISYIQSVTFLHLRVLPPSLDYVAEELMEILPKIKDGETRREGLGVVEPLAIRLANSGKKRAFFSQLLGDSDFSIRLEAAVLLSRIDGSVTNGIPILLNAVTNRSLMASTFVLPPGFSDQVKIKQEEAHEALKRVSPSLARSYQITK